jgi:hypothetical protein
MYLVHVVFPGHLVGVETHAVAYSLHVGRHIYHLARKMCVVRNVYAHIS